MADREPERRTDGYNYRRKTRVWLAGLAGPIFLAVTGYAAVSLLEWYNFGNALKIWKPQVEIRLDNLETKQDTRQEEILKELRYLRREMRERDKEKN